MTDLEISKALALAIGWNPEQIRVSAAFVPALLIQRNDKHFARAFDYRDWTVIGPIAARYNAFPVRFDDGPDWYSNTWTGTRLHQEFADTPQKAIALAVIGAMK